MQLLYYYIYTTNIVVDRKGEQRRSPAEQKTAVRLWPSIFYYLWLITVYKIVYITKELSTKLYIEIKENLDD